MFAPNECDPCTTPQAHYIDTHTHSPLLDIFRGTMVTASSVGGLVLRIVAHQACQSATAIRAVPFAKAHNGRLEEVVKL